MPVIGAVIGAIMTGLLYWFLWGGGMDYVDAMLRDRQDKKRKAVKTIAAGTPPLKALKDPREAATALMVAAALARGVVTPEQLDAIRQQMIEILGYGTDVEERLTYCRFAAEQAQSPEVAIDDTVAVLRAALDPAEREELRGMLDKVVAVHGGPTERQERFVERMMRRLAQEV